LVRELVNALSRCDQQNDYRLFIAGATNTLIPTSPGSNFSYRTTRVSPRWLARIWQRMRVPLPVEFYTGSIDLYHATDFVLPPTRPGTRTIVTVHDLSFVRVPDAATPRLKAYLDQVVPRSVKRADHVIADSSATKQDIIDIYNIPEEKISVLLSGVSTHFKPEMEHRPQIQKRYNLPEKPYIFSVGTVQPRKNYERLVRSLAQLHTHGYDVDLVIAGGKGWLDGPLYQTIIDTGMKDFVHLIGFADDRDLPMLYSAAECVAFPSLYEGFGFPVLEGMACGTPVITSNVSSLPEVAGDAAIMVDPYNVEMITDALIQVLSDQHLRNNMIQRGFTQAAQFTWEAAATNLLSIYDRVLQPS
jgi:glycosyltransferase involved in cell wall biosynthesis